MGTLEVKLTSGVVLFLVTLTGCLLPFCIFRRVLKHDPSGAERSASLPSSVGLLHAVAGGVFVGTSLLHLLPECLETMAAAMPEADYPVGEVTLALGFLSLLVLEHLVLACQERSEKLDETAENSKQKSRGILEPNVRYVKRANRDVNPQTTVASSDKSFIRYGAVDESIEGGESMSDSDDEDVTYIGNCDDSYKEPLLASRDEPANSYTPTTVRKRPFSATSEEEEGARQGKGTGRGRSEGKDERVVGLRSFMLFLALSLHTVFDGLVVGLQETEALIWTLLVALSIHKAVVAFSLGLNHLQSHARRVKVALAYLGVFSLVTPFGVALGTLLTEVKFDERARNYVSGVLQCFASGTFMYVTFFEGLKLEAKGNRRVLHVFLVLLGFAIVAVLRFFINDD